MRAHSSRNIETPPVPTAELRMTLLGERARKYRSWHYRRPLLSRIDEWQVNPGRLIYGRDFPCDVQRPAHVFNGQTEDCCDVKVSIIGPDDSAVYRVQLWLMPNEHTESGQPWVACEFFANADSADLLDQCADLAVRLAFK